MELKKREAISDDCPDASELETPIGTLTDDPLGDDVDAQIEQQLEAERAKDLLRFSTAGSVDDGKSTLIGRFSTTRATSTMTTSAP